MIFLTVGTQFPFERLVRRVDEIVGEGGFDEEIFAQIGLGTYRPRNLKFVEYIDKKQFDKLFNDAKSIIGHAGMGTIIAALQLGKPLLVMPRLKRYREVVNDHQLAIAKKFSELQHILVAYDTEDLPERIRQLKSFVPKERKANPDAVADRIRNFLNNLQT